MAHTTNRLLLEIEKAIKDINRETISEVIPEVTFESIAPVMTLAARTRAEYLKAMFNLATTVGDGLPDEGQVAHLRQLRQTYDEMVSGAQSLETAIQRGYIDVKGRN